MAFKTPSGDKWERSPGYVYFIAAGDPPHIAIKIGISTQRDFMSRFRAHQGSNHEPLYLLGVIPVEDGERPMLDARAREDELHRRFAHLQRFKHTWAGSEWFTVAPELLDFVVEVAAPPEARGLQRSVATPGPGRIKPPPS